MSDPSEEQNFSMVRPSFVISFVEERFMSVISGEIWNFAFDLAVGIYYYEARWDRLMS